MPKDPAARTRLESFRARTPLVAAAAVAAALLVAVSPARAELGHRVALAGGFEGWHADGLGGHGWGLVGYDLEGLPAEGRFALELNTDTLRIGVDRFRVLNGALETGAYLSGEVGLAGLLTDYYREGELLPERGFYASYLAAEAYLKANLREWAHVELSFGARRWLFAPAGDTSPDLVLPPEAWVFEPRARITIWHIRDDPSLGDRHRLYPRIRGLALGLDIGADIRSDARPWGALDAESFDPADPRNAGRTVIFVGRQWLRAGWQATDRLRLQVAEAASFGNGGDDLSRTRLGGMNPYVVPLAGIPWAAILSDQFLAAEVSLHVRIWRRLELGVAADGAFVEDVERAGSKDVRFVGGVALFADLAIGAFQLDLRAGWSPSFGLDDGGSWSALAALGWGWSS